MANYTIEAVPSGSKKTNIAQRTISDVFPYDENKYRTIEKITRTYGIWCSTGGKYYSVDLEGRDQLIHSDTGAVIKTSSVGTSKCHGTGPAAENYMTCVFENWTQEESNAAVAAWAAGKLLIKRTSWVVKATSSSHKQPVEREGYYDDTITIEGSTLPFTNYKPQIKAFTCMRSDDGKEEKQLSTRVYASIQLAMNDQSGLEDKPELVLSYSTREDFSSNVTNVTIGTTSTAIKPYFELKSFSVGNSFSVGSDYYFMLTFKAGLEVAVTEPVRVSMGHTPLHIPQSNAGVAIGMYSNATGEDPRCEINYPLYLYKGIAQVGSAGQDTLAMLGIQTGRSPAQRVSSSRVAVVDVTFPKAYVDVPTVIANIVSEEDTYYLGRCNVAIVSVTASGFTARIANGGSNPVTFGFDWAAFGRMN